ncbi:TolC family outer membrane protein [Pseudoxanthomonas dokdonensis]|uniref:Membrane protein n=1 Tax=Pseudoxanthomonas dokdonensis TaxID=344882 RepID=A0A0R0CFU0_9GAMM|nr:TolC family outer membrane protein [Pseudoxanthomonas dokdonensis]KRG68607.1 membrane protein [Pseudoxanthomonas dokdonensis]
MIRRPLALALAMALPFSAGATDLLQTYELARTGDPQLSIAESTTEFNQEGKVQARAALLPQINGSAGYSRSHSSRPGNIAPSGLDLGDTKGRTYGIDVSQTIFDWSRISNLRAEGALSQAADYDLAAANQQLITRTSQAYFDVLVAIESLAAAETNEEAGRKQFDYAQKRLDVGLAPITDVHEARARYDEARANTILVRNALDDNYRALLELTGQPVTNLKGLPEDFRPELPPVQDPQQWVSAAVDQNPTLKSTEAQLQASEYGVSTARAAHYPTLNLGGSYNNGAGWDSVHGPGTPTYADDEGYTVGLTLNVPIFAGGAIQSRVRQAINQRDIAQDQYEQTRRALIRNTSSAYQALSAGISEVEARRLAVVSAQSAYDASQVGLEVGTRTVLDVLQNQQTLFQSQLDYAEAKYRFLQNRLLLEAAAGTLDINDVQDINRLLTADAEAQLKPSDTVRPNIQ